MAENIISVGTLTTVTQPLTRTQKVQSHVAGNTAGNQNLVKRS